MSIPVHLSTNLVAGAGLIFAGIIASASVLVGFVLMGAVIDIDHVLYMVFKYPKTTVKDKIAIGQEYHKAMPSGVLYLPFAGAKPCVDCI